MLLEMRLRGLGVISEAVLEFGPGLTVVTGETGAGKTMVVTGLGLLLGGRADPGAVRGGESAAVVEGRVAVDPAGPAARIATEAGAAMDDGEVLVLSRSVSAEGRSRAHLGGRSVPVATLLNLSTDLIAVHGQSDQLRLQSQTRQREALDRFAGDDLRPLLARYRGLFQRLRTVETQLTELTERSRERAQEAELLRHGLAEVERLEPRAGEDAALRAEAERLAHAEDLQRAAGTAHRLLTGDPDAAVGGADARGLVADARRALDAMRDHDPGIAALADRLAEVGYLVDDLGAECASYAAQVESDPLRLAAVEQRRADLAGMVRAYGEDVDGVLDWARRSASRLAELDGDTDTIGELRAERDRVRDELGAAAAAVSRVRTDAAARLSEAVTAELPELSMPGARLVVEVRQRQEEGGLPVEVGPAVGLTEAASRPAVGLTEAASRPAVRNVAAGPDGVDDVEMLLAAHPGAPPRPLGKGASGGELSRVMLGLEVVLGAADPVPTFVFDEVDAGVGGRAALGIGRRLARLARTSQVLVVTHLPQVAAFADRHLLVVKSGDGAITESGVHPLDDGGRVRELARMLGGVAESGAAQAHAEELLALGAAERAPA